MKAVCNTDCGKVRAHNEDSVGVLTGENGQILSAVADGMGGHAAGEVASRLALEMIEKKWHELDHSLTRDEAIQWLNHLVRSLNVHLFDYAEKHPECHGMGTTLAAALCSEDYIAITAVGDSRIYMWKEGEGIRQCTEDHTLVHELVKSGQISKKDAEVHPDRHVLMRALGTEPAIQLDTQLLNWEGASYLVICSDGLTNELSDEEITVILGEKMSLYEKTEQLIREANDAGGKDNISVIIISHDSDGDRK
ncbi:Stp1/IreP family PP2C-type Ser/Thr phosphatase [Sporolactobacillus sp. Y61]|jgi:protein phosphatase|uniref:Stp1/IreP family PP2C-type Ser/Thr phosphatase n=1 Tax=Sporolactobacillus sp. Y61 TaxID=3160863 RepID=A0AAU8IDC6_9BACL|nr:Stp1/IreP family PP2C-type Ser/Thr phosphatase [Sporolactobacillus sp. THM19-2]RYL92911.1 Stp1/IreP family PP2C-type Ser/Thr phosphatase [Sporolactobacillus sp. THM19-2]